MTPEIVCIGQAVVDCITKDREEQPHKKNVYRAKSIGLSSGGDALNQAILLSQFGYQVKLAAGLGMDAAGSLILSEAKKWYVDVSEVSQMEELTTPIANIIVKEDGSRSSVNSEATKLSGYVPDVSVVKGAKLVSLGSLFRAPLDQKEVIIDLIKAAKEEGAIVCADTKMPTFREIGLKDIEEVLPLIDFIFPNETEAAFYTGKTSLFEMAQTIYEMGVKNVIIKAGEKGCFVRSKDIKFAMGSIKVDAVDTTGAGDNFVSGFIHGLFQEWDLKTCCEYGTACAAVSVGLPGATSKADLRKYAIKKLLGHS